jgi:hypothetical protein
MSGGHFDYNQYHISRIIDDIELLIEKAKKEEEYYKFSKETIEEFEMGLYFLRRAFIYTHEIDWLVSGDTGEDSFKRRINQEMEKLNAINQ